MRERCPGLREGYGLFGACKSGIIADGFGVELRIVVAVWHAVNLLKLFDDLVDEFTIQTVLQETFQGPDVALRFHYQVLRLLRPGLLLLLEQARERQLSHMQLAVLDLKFVRLALGVLGGHDLIFDEITN